MTSIMGLGRAFDIGLGVAPVDINTADAATGKRLSLAQASGVTFLLVTGVGGADDIVVDVQQHTAYTGGTSADLDPTGVTNSSGVTFAHIKAETALDNDESWVKLTQSEASEVTIAGATYGTQQKIVAIYVSAEQLAPGYTHVSANIACTTSTSQLVALLYVLHDLKVQRTPANLPNLLRPGAANA